MNGRITTTHPNRPAWRRLTALTALFLLLAGVAPLRAADVTALFDTANRLYEQGRHAEAATTYQRMIDDGHRDPAILHNLGNAWFKAGQTGRAIAAWREAGQWIPRDPGLRFNLQFARQQVPAPNALRQPAWQRWVGTLTVNEWTALTAAAFWLFFIGLAAREWRPALRRPLRNTLLALCSATALLGLCLGAAVHWQYFVRHAVVVGGSADIRHGPLEESQAAFTAPDGTELRVVDRKDDWLQVINPAGQSGWLHQGAVILLRPAADSPS